MREDRRSGANEGGYQAAGNTGKRAVIDGDREQFLLLDYVKPSSQPYVCHVALMLHALWRAASMLHHHPFL